MKESQENIWEKKADRDLVWGLQVYYIFIKDNQSLPDVYKKNKCVSNATYERGIFKHERLKFEALKIQMLPIMFTIVNETASKSTIR